MALIRVAELNFDQLCDAVKDLPAAPREDILAQWIASRRRLLEPPSAGTHRSPHKVVIPVLPPPTEPEAQKPSEEELLEAVKQAPHVGRAIRILRENKELLQSDVYQAIKVSQPNYCTFENNGRSFSLDRIKNILDVLEIAPGSAIYEAVVAKKKCERAKAKNTSATLAAIEPGIPVYKMLKHARVRRGLTQEEAADLAQLPLHVYAPLERSLRRSENRGTDIDLLIDICIQLGVDEKEMAIIVKQHTKERQALLAQRSSAVERTDPLGKMLYNLRFKQGLSQKDAAEKVGVTHSAWSQYETGAVVPTDGVVCRIIVEFNLDSEAQRALQRLCCEAREKKKASRWTSRVETDVSAEAVPVIT